MLNRKLWMVFIAALLLCAVSTFAAPTISFEKTEIDYGKIVQGQKINLSFPFKNTGDSELEILNVTATCGCTEAKASSTKIAPGASATIEAVFNSTGFRGKVQKGIGVQTNDPERQHVRLNMIAEIVPIATVSPERVNFNQLKSGEVYEANIVIQPTDPESFRIIKIENNNKLVSIPELRRARDGKGTYYMKVRVQGGETPGRIFEQLKIITDIQGNPAISLMVYGNVLSKTEG